MGRHEAQIVELQAWLLHVALLLHVCLGKLACKEEARGGDEPLDKVPSEHYRQEYKKGLGRASNNHKVVQLDLDPDPQKAGVATAVVDCDPSSVKACRS
jgi:hypothetical protein